MRNQVSGTYHYNDDPISLRLRCRCMGARFIKSGSVSQPLTLREGKKVKVLVVEAGVL